MKLEHIQNELKNYVGDFVRTEAKEATVLWLHEKGLPAAREVSAAYTAALKESAEKETGWCRFRDRIRVAQNIQSVDTGLCALCAAIRSPE